MSLSSPIHQAPRITAYAAADAMAMTHLYETSIAANPAGFIQNLAFHEEINRFALRMQQQGGSFAVARPGVADAACATVQALRDTARDALIAMGGLRPSADNPHAVELCKLHVAGGQQGRGFGCCMALHLIAEAQALGYKEMILNVTTSQQAAIHLYRKLGFEEGLTEVWRGAFQGEHLEFEICHMRLDLTQPVSCPLEIRAVSPQA